MLGPKTIYDICIGRIILTFHVASKYLSGGEGGGEGEEGEGGRSHSSRAPIVLQFCDLLLRTKTRTRTRIHVYRDTVYYTRLHTERNVHTTGHNTHSARALYAEQIHTDNPWKEIIIELFLWIKNKLSVIYNN